MGARKAEPMKPGMMLQEGVVVRHDDAGVWVGRLADPGEVCPAGHTEHQLGDRRVFLADGQVAIPPGALHRRGK